MQTVTCSYCNAKFDFDASKVWDSPGPITPLPGSPTRVVIQCTECQRWIQVSLEEESRFKIVTV